MEDKLLHPEYFFDLNTSSHKDLFLNCPFVWEVLDRLPSYLESLELGSIKGLVSKNAYLVKPELISIGEGSIVEPGAYIEGPCHIGKNCQVRHGAYVRGNVIADDRSIIGHDTEIKGSILLKGAQAAHFAYVGDSILGNNINLGAGTKCANLRLDNKKISVTVLGELYQTQRRKLGLIAGDGSSLGCNSVSNPGTLLGPGVLTYPCSNFGGFIEENKRIKR